MVSYEPLELTTKSSTLLFPVTIVDSDDSNFEAHIPFATSLLSTSGYEPTYNPDFCNKSENIKRANCYAYSMGFLTKKEGKLQPGAASGKVFTSLTKKERSY